MKNFTYYNPTRIVFGKGTITQLADLVPPEARVLLTFGGGSIRENGVHEQVIQALGDRYLVEFGGIEPNPRFHTLIRAAETGQRERCDFLLSVGGGSVLDGTKLVAAMMAMNVTSEAAWRIVLGEVKPTAALPLGAVLTLPATGSESNGNAVVSRDDIQQKRAFGHPLLYPQFSILDPETTFSLPERQTRNGIIDAYIHVMEQYLTYPQGAPLQDRQAEAVLLTLIEEGPKVLQTPGDYDARANVMWCATQALNGIIRCGVVTDWATHQIGHELTVLYGLDHGQTLAVILPAVMTHQKDRKREKLLQYGERVFGLTGGTDDDLCAQAIAATVEFFESLGQPTRLKGYGVGDPEAPRKVADRLAERDMKLGEHKAIGPQEIREIVQMAL